MGNDIREIKIYLCHYDSVNLMKLQVKSILKNFTINDNDCVEKVNGILNNYDKYLDMIDSAYNKVINNYTTECFITKINNLF
jgi:hypothetical protein